jgi:hypothetical protein
MFCVCNIQEQLLRNRKTYIFNKAPLYLESVWDLDLYHERHLGQLLGGGSACLFLGVCDLTELVKKL